ncbi:TPA: DegT/DnrJ/EryC1/StrS aminotransferase family protein [Vibrio cholerae]|nr:DegT/DnrJ/EryC1/StrS aminotransferase family protein [Vibrio cholerae]HDB1450985.1 DegT/DnrJ/EryC1/StrS aminotransferase family protein [Vibrio cholerae]
MTMIPVYQPRLSGNEKKYVNECLDSTWISSKGEFINRFESAFSKYIGAENCTTVSNGTVALHLALAALGIGPGDEVIVPSFTYIASVNTIIQTGAKAVYVDSLPDTWNIDVNDVIAKITTKTKAVMAVHLYGLPCDMDALVDVCKKHNLFLIEDCAEAFGTLYKNKHVGTFGDVATFSFFGNKTITTGEGGMVVSKDKNVHDLACHLKSQGVSKVKEYWHDALAFNYRMTNICAAIGLAQLEQADEIIAKKREIASWYQRRLNHLPITFHKEIENTKHSFWMCSILVENAQDRDLLRTVLKSHDVETRPLFPLANTMPHVFTEHKFPVAENISSRGMNLPSYPELLEKDVDYICNVISDFYLNK